MKKKTQIIKSESQKPIFDNFNKYGKTPFQYFNRIVTLNQDIRRCRSKVDLFPFQETAICNLADWYKSKKKRQGKILSMPTGSGKTLVAVRFLCQFPLSQSYKVLWLAHTRHLLEQAYFTFLPDTKEEISDKGMELAHVENKETIRLKIVSGEGNHFKLAEIKPKQDDIIFATIQSIISGRNNNNKKLKDFLDSNKNGGYKVMIVFDEAHHAAADKYFKLLKEFQSKNFPVLGLTATPDHSDQSRRGRLRKIFSNRIVPPKNDVSIKKLQKQGVLAHIKVLDVKYTGNKPSFSQYDYNDWKKESDQFDIPKYIIESMAENKDRNEQIVNYYCNNKEEFGKTIIYADRWWQCESLCKLLEKKGVTAGAVYSHIHLDRSNADKRNERRRKPSEIQQDLADFKEGKIKVLINIRMLTEGTNVPDVQTVFITRQTTSEILLRQMIGRAMRGHLMMDTHQSRTFKTANIVMFEDNWQSGEILKEFAELPQDLVTAKPSERSQNKNQMRWVSIDMISKLTNIMNTNSSIAALNFDEYFPLGWYKIELEEKNDHRESAVLVYNHESEGYKKLIKHLSFCKKEAKEAYKKKITKKLDFGMEKIPNDLKTELKRLKKSFFEDAKEITNLSNNIKLIYRHILEYSENPKFIDIKDRKKHDIKLLAKKYINKKISDIDKDELLHKEYKAKNKLWETMYDSYDTFKKVYNYAKEELLAKKHGRMRKKSHKFEQSIQGKMPKDQEPSEARRQEVKERDKVCQCCGNSMKMHLEVDHIIPKAMGGDHDRKNLQLLCKTCHKLKKGLESKKEFNFLSARKVKKYKLNMNEFFEKFKKPIDNKVTIIQLVRRIINFHYGCRAVQGISLTSSYITNKKNIKLKGSAGIDWQHLQSFQKKLLLEMNRVSQFKIGKMITEK